VASIRASSPSGPCPREARRTLGARARCRHRPGEGAAVIAQATKSAAAQRITARLAADLTYLERVVEDMGRFTDPLPVERRRERLRHVVNDALAMAQENVTGAGWAAENVPAGTLAADSGVAGTLEDVPAGTPWNDRQSWVLHELSRIGKLTRLQIENAFHVGEKTAKRDMQALREAGLVEFVRQGRDGHYRLRKGGSPR
jgi:hypothetical protein